MGMLQESRTQTLNLRKYLEIIKNKREQETGFWEVTTVEHLDNHHLKRL
jgi:hypothetical protein